MHPRITRESILQNFSAISPPFPWKHEHRRSKNCCNTVGQAPPAARTDECFVLLLKLHLSGLEGCWRARATVIRWKNRRRHGQISSDRRRSARRCRVASTDPSELRECICTINRAGVTRAGTRQWLAENHFSDMQIFISRVALRATQLPPAEVSRLLILVETRRTV